MTSDIISAILQIFGIFAVGWGARSLGYIHESELDRWSKFVVDILFPFLIFSSICRDFEVDRFYELWALPLIGVGMIVFGAGSGFLLRNFLKNRDAAFRKTFHHFCAINNYGFLPIIIITNLWGPVAVSRLFFLNLGSTIGYWTIGVTLLGDGNNRAAWKNIINPSILALILSLAISLTGLNSYIPAVIMNICNVTGSAAIPCVLLLIGASLYPLPSFKNIQDLAYLNLVRLILLPALTIFIILLLPLNADVRNIALIVALMPASVSSCILTRRFGGDPEFAGQAAIVTTIMAIITVPGAVWVLEVLGYIGR